MKNIIIREAKSDGLMKIKEQMTILNEDQRIDNLNIQRTIMLK